MSPATIAAASASSSIQEKRKKPVRRDGGPPFKRRKLDGSHQRVPSQEMSTSAFPRGKPTPSNSTIDPELAADFTTQETKNGESLAILRKMIFGRLEHTSSQSDPGKYLAVDCEMVGVGIDGEESSLARVSIVNYWGAVQMDEIVKQKERVVDYRTQWSGIRPSDMVRAKPFEEVQKRVAALTKDRILVGHAIHNDLKVLLLSHPGPCIRDTQQLAAKHRLTGKRPALRNLVKQEIGVIIQGGEHSSVTDARATMAVFRLHRKEWEKGFRPLNQPGSGASKKQKHSESDTPDELTPTGRGRKGVSSGLSTIVKRTPQTKPKANTVKVTNCNWWSTLDARGTIPKGSMKL